MSTVNATKNSVAEDMIRVAHMYNNILYKKNYYRHGYYKMEDVNQHFTSFANACRLLQIVNPEDPWDINAVLEDIRFVIKDQKDISVEIYRNNGIYTVESLYKRYGKFSDLIRLAHGPKLTNEKVYPFYKVKSDGRNIALKWLKQ